MGDFYTNDNYQSTVVKNNRNNYYTVIDMCYNNLHVQ